LRIVSFCLATALAIFASTEGFARNAERHASRAVSDRDFYDNGRPDPLKVELGRLLFFDKVLSGNENISCATCHHSLTDTGDGLSLPVGEGGVGLGLTRSNGHGADAVHERVPRNAPPIFNLGAREFETLFWDGRVSLDEDGNFISPAGSDLPEGLDNPLAVQAMFPVTSGAEMAGQPGENAQADAAAAGDLPLVWEIIAEKLRSIPEYVDRFSAVFDDVNDAADLTYVHAANAIAAFEAHDWRFDDSPFDRHLRGDRGALSGDAKRGMRLFYGKAACGTCHSGKFQTDQSFHAIAMPQIGPGKGDGIDGNEDFGRYRETGDPDDRFRFRTPTLRNVALTGPWGHAGAYDSLEAVVKHHLHPRRSLLRYDRSQAVLPPRPDLDALDFQVMDDPSKVRSIAEANELRGRKLGKSEFRDLMAFLDALTDPAAQDLRKDIPFAVPSGLPVFD
jgi:cytochrome c peroxidase